MQRYYIKNKGEILQVCLGISLINISFGLAIAIAKTDSLSLGHKSNTLTLTKKAVQLNSEAEKLEELATEIKQKTRSKKSRDEADKITSELKATRQQIGEIVEDREEKEEQGGNI